MMNAHSIVVIGTTYNKLFCEFWTTKMTAITSITTVSVIGHSLSLAFHILV